MDEILQHGLREAEAEVSRSDRKKSEVASDDACVLPTQAASDHDISARKNYALVAKTQFVPA